MPFLLPCCYVSSVSPCSFHGTGKAITPVTFESLPFILQANTLYPPGLHKSKTENNVPILLFAEIWRILARSLCLRGADYLISNQPGQSLGPELLYHILTRREGGKGSGLTHKPRNAAADIQEQAVVCRSTSCPDIRKGMSPIQGELWQKEPTDKIFFFFLINSDFLVNECL